MASGNLPHRALVDFNCLPPIFVCGWPAPRFPWYVKLAARPTFCPSSIFTGKCTFTVSRLFYKRLTRQTFAKIHNQELDHGDGQILSMMECPMVCWLYLMIFQWFWMVANHWPNDGTVMKVFQRLHQPLVSLVFGLATIASDGFFNSFQWLLSIGQTMEW